MKPIYNSKDLHMHIQMLEAQSKQQEDELKTMAGDLVESLKPVNLIRNTFKSTVSSPNFGVNLLKGAAGLAAGFLSKKLLVKSSSGIFKKALGAVVELGVAKVVANKAQKITATGMKLLHKTSKSPS